MRILFLILTGLLLIGAPLQQAFGQQQYPVQIQPTVSFPSTFINDYADPENTNVRVYLADLTKVNYKINIRVKLEGTGNNVVYESINGINITLDGGQVYFLNDQDLALLFATTNLTTNAAAQTGFANSLPEGVYNMSFEAFDASLLPVKIPVSNSRTDFTIFNVVRYDPPMLNAPNNAEAFDMQTINQNIFFTWTPRHVVYSPKQQVKYRFSLIKVIPVDRNPYDAMKAAVPTSTGNIVVSDLDFPTFIYSPADLPLEEGCVYAWQVQAYEVVNGIQKATTRFKNEGYSEVFTFSVKENCEPVTINPVSVSGNQVTLSWFGSTISTYSEYEVNYRQAMTSLPWTPVLTSQTSITLDNTVLQSDVTYEFTVKARCKNWQSPVYGGTFKIEQATCVAPRPITVETKSGSPVLTWIDNAGVDSIRLYYREKSSTAPFTRVLIAGGTQTYTLPPLSQDGYIVELDAVCGTETGAGIKDTFNYNDNGQIGPCPIPMPFQFSALRVVGDTAMLGWQQAPGNTGYSITYWHKDSAAVTHTINNLLTPSTKANLLFDNQLYAYKVTFMCGTKTTTTPVGMFRIDGTINSVPLDPKTADCFPPVDLQGQARSTTSAFVEWNKIDGADEYQLFYGVKGTKPFKPFTTTATSTTLKNLDDSQQYQFVVRVRCGGLYSIFSDTALVDLGQDIDSKNCDTVAFMAAIKKTTTNILLAWKYNANYSGYIITYRESAQPPSSVYTQAFTNIDTLVQNHLYGDSVKYTFQNLKAGTEYIFTIQAVCGAGKAFINAPLKVSTMPDAKSSGTCGSANACDKTDKTPLTALNVGEKFHCADYEVTVDKIDSPNSSTGMYTGNGHMNMPIAGVGDFVTMNISFSNIKINTDPNRCVVEGIINVDSINAGLLPTDVRKQISGYMDQVTDAIDQANDLLAQAQDGLNQAQDAVQQATDYFQGGENTGSVVTGELGETKVTGTVPTTTTSATVSGNSVTLPPCPAVTVASFPALLKDDAGNVFQVTSTGAVVHVGTYDNTYAVSPVTVDPSTQQVVFEENTTAKYDFDMWKPEYKGVLQIEREYEKINSDYYVPAKCITPAEMDVVNAKLSGTGADPTKVVFANGKGFVYKFTKSGSTFTVNLAGGPPADAQEIYAWYVEGSTKTAIGKLLVPSYGRQIKDVVIIPVDLVKNTKQTVSTTTYENFLNKTYGRLGITYHVTVDDAFRGNTSWDADGNNSVQVKGSPILSNDYQGEEKAMIEAYVALKGGASALDPNTAYFLAPYEVSQIESNLLGKMPAEEQFGFLYTASTTQDGIARTIAHELGHGAYHLEHIFNTAYLGPGKNDAIKNGSLNLMSYFNDPKANELWKFQWDVVNAPGHVWGILQKDKNTLMVSSKYTDLSNNAAFINEDKTTITYLCPNGQYITLPKEYKVAFNAVPTFLNDLQSYVLYGSLEGFITTKGNEYFIKTSGAGEFLSYSFVKNSSANAVYQQEDLTVPYYVAEVSYDSKDVFPSTKYGKAYGLKKLVYFRWTAQTPEAVVYTASDLKLDYYLTQVNLMITDPNFYDLVKTTFTAKNILGSVPIKVGGNNSDVSALDQLKAISDKHKDTPVIVYAQKIGLWSVLNPSLFEYFTNSTRFLKWSDLSPHTYTVSTGMYTATHTSDDLGYWEELLKKNPTVQNYWKNGQYDLFYKVMLTELEAVDAIDKWKLLDTISINCNPYTAARVIALFLDEDIDSETEMNWDKRLLLLRVLTRNDIYDPIEKNIVKLVRTTPAEDYSKLLNALITIKNAGDTELLLHKLINGVYSGLNDKEYQDFTLLIHSYATSINRCSNVDEFVALNKANGRYFQFDPAFWNGQPTVIDVSVDGKIFMAHRSDFNWITGAPLYDQINVNPYECVTLYFSDDKTIGGFTFTKDKTYTTTAIVAYMLMKGAILDNYKILAMTAINVALMTTGIGELTMAIQAGRTAATVMAATDVGFGLGGILVETRYRDKWQNDPTGKKVLAFWDLTNTIYAGVAITGPFILRAQEAKAAVKQMRDAATNPQDIRLLDETMDQADNVEKLGVNATLKFTSAARSGGSAANDFAPIINSVTNKNLFKTLEMSDDITKKLAFDQLSAGAFNDVAIDFFDKGGDILYNVRPRPIIPTGGRNGIAAADVVVLEAEGVDLVKSLQVDNGLTASLVAEYKVTSNLTDQAVIDLTTTSALPKVKVYKVTSPTLGEALYVEEAVQNSTQTATRLIYATETFTNAIIQQKKKNSCSYCRTNNKNLCTALQTLRTTSGDDFGVKILCNSSIDDITLKAIADKLNSFAVDTQKVFLTDIRGTGQATALCANVNKLNADLVDAWKLVFRAKGTYAYKKDFVLLKQIVVMRSAANAAMYTNLGGDFVLVKVMAKNVAAQCNGCGNSATWVQYMDEYLKDVAYFVETYDQTPGNSYVFSSGITSNSPGQVYGAVYMLKVLRKNTAIQPTMFEDAISASGTLKGCHPDAKIGDQILEFKSWSPNDTDTDVGSMGPDDDEEPLGKSYFKKFSENDYTPGNSSSYTQFLCYLNRINNMNQLSYYFDKDLIVAKGQTDAGLYVKNIFKMLYTNNKQSIFNVIWNNASLRNTLFLGLTISEAEDSYDDLVADQNSLLYSMINVK